MTLRRNLLDDRGDVPGWVLITLMTAGLSRSPLVGCQRQLANSVLELCSSSDRLQLFHRKGPSLAFRSTSPAGIRCACNAMVASATRNQWIRTIEGYRMEMDALHSNELHADMSPAEHADLFARLVRLMNRAELGELTIGKGPNFDADVMDRHGGWILELKPRPESRSSFGRPVRHLRMYCAEPERLANHILALHVATKADEGDWAAEQDAAIDESAHRADHWSWNTLGE